MGTETLTPLEWAAVIAGGVIGFIILAGIVLLYLSALIIAYKRNHAKKHYILAICVIFGVGSTLYALNYFNVWGNVVWVVGSIIVGIAIFVWSTKAPKRVKKPEAEVESAEK